MSFSINNIIQVTENGTSVSVKIELVSPNCENIPGSVVTMTNGDCYFKRESDNSLFPILSAESLTPLKSFKLYDEVALGREIPYENTIVINKSL